jgi:hypothetical protein
VDFGGVEEKRFEPFQGRGGVVAPIGAIAVARLPARCSQRARQECKSVGRGKQASDRYFAAARSRSR